MSSDPPSVTVIVPTRGRPQALRRCLAALAVQDYPRARLSVVVVCDGEPAPSGVSGDGVTALEQARAGPAAARNLGAAAARGSLLAFTDDDCVPGPDWVRRLVDCGQGRPGVGVGGQVVSGSLSPWSRTAVGIIALSRSTHHPHRAPFLASGNLMLDAAGFQAIGGFDPAFSRAAEDRDLCDRWIGSGRSLIYEPRALVAHHHHHDLRSFVVTHAAYGSGAHRLARVRAQRGAGGVVDPRFYLAIARSALTEGPGHAARLIVWQLANLYGYTRARARERRGQVERTS